MAILTTSSRDGRGAVH